MLMPSKNIFIYIDLGCNHNLLLQYFNSTFHHKNIYFICLIYDYPNRANAEAQDPPNNPEYTEEYEYGTYDGEYGADYDENLYGEYGM